MRSVRVDCAVRYPEFLSDRHVRPALVRRALRAVVVGMAGACIGAGGVVLWRQYAPLRFDWNAMLALAIFAAVATALVPVVREDRRRTRQAELLRFRLWVQFSKLRWLLTHLGEHDPTRPFFSPGVGGEELHAIEVLLAQAHLLEVAEYEWLIFTVNAALPYYGRPTGEMAPHATRLLWTIDATLAELNRRATRSPD
jgi:hypothetical protein